MKIEFIDNFGFCEELPLKNIEYNISSYWTYMKLTIENERIDEILINDNQISFDVENNSIIISCLFNIENLCKIQIKHTDNQIRYVLKYKKSMEVDKKVIESLGDFYRKTIDVLDKGTIDLDRLIAEIEHGKINLLHVLDPLTGLSNNEFLDSIKLAIPFALNICTNPRQHLKLENEILDVSLVKRINTKSLQHLASHSEHWKARTITGLIPSRMLAEVYEDDLNIYENIFFRLLIEKVLLYINEKDMEVKKALIQKNSLIDWEQYGYVLSDYKRGEMLKRLMPEYDFDEEDFKREEFKELLSKLEKLKKGLTSVVSTSFYQSLNKFKNIELPIQPTNIIKMDTRYNELFKLWNKMLEFETQNNQEDLNGETIDNINYYYLLYTQILLVYGFTISGFKKNEDSYLNINDDGCSELNVCFYNNNFDVKCKTNIENNINKIEIIITEKLNLKFKIPTICNLNDELSSFKEFCEINLEDSSYIIIKKKPSIEYQDKIRNIFKKNKEELKNLSSESIQKLERMDKEWRKFFVDKMMNLKEPKTFKINIYPLLGSLGNDEIDLKKNTDSLLNSIINYIETLNEESNIITMPIDLYKFEKVKNGSLISRMLNYGEAYDTNDAKKWGNYRVGILPISQTEINSIQRLIKAVNINLSRLAIEWNLSKNSCPVCESTNIEKLDENTFQCKNNNCGVLWGNTRCSNGCGKDFTWIRPSINISKSDIEENNPLNLILKKESIFDRLIITDFDFIEENKIIKYVPKCPKCGYSSATCNK